MDMRTRGRIIEQWENYDLGNGKTENRFTNDHLFKVKSLEKHPSQQIWVPMPGGQMHNFIGGTHQYEYIGINGEVSLDALREIDEVQAPEVVAAYEEAKASEPPKKTAKAKPKGESEE